MMLLILPGASVADEYGDAPDAARVPLMVLTRHSAPTASEIGAIVAGLDAPILDGRGLSKRLRLVPPPDDDVVSRIEAAANEGENLFFSGSLEAAIHYFEKVVSIAASHEGLLAHHPNIREKLFKSHIYAAQAADRLDGRRAAEPHLEAAAALEGFSPRPEEFPPWICDTFASIKQGRPRAAGTLSLSAPNRCHLFVNGRDLGMGPNFQDVAAGTAYLNVVCGNQKSLVAAVEIQENTTTSFTPLLIRGSLAIVDNTAIYSDPPNSDAHLVFSDLAAIGAAADTPRMVVLVSRDDGLETWIFDVVHRRPLRKSKANRQDNAAIIAGTRKLMVNTQPLESPGSTLSAMPWYRDIAGWVSVGTGIAALGAGVALLLTADSQSLQTPISYSVMAAGGGLLGSGIIILVIPPLAVNNDIADAGVEVGLSVGARF
jgi:hypothetical protein